MGSPDTSFMGSPDISFMGIPDCSFMGSGDCSDKVAWNFWHDNYHKNTGTIGMCKPF
jgi:hypothetical protein